jgi:quercetin dioxygenase-like cupin family protein
MKLRQDLSRWELVPFESTVWAPSPEPRVERKMLERDGAEAARATSIVRYAKGSAFGPHSHELGEEFVVLDGTFSDEHGDYPAGSYVRNPPGSRHRPFSVGGCTIFVKLRQFELADARQCVVALDAADAPAEHSSATLLHVHGSERVSLLQLAAGATRALEVDDRGSELFVLSGDLSVGSEACGVWTWLRAPGKVPALHSASGARVWLKQGHLPRLSHP